MEIICLQTAEEIRQHLSYVIIIIIIIIITIIIIIKRKTRKEVGKGIVKSEEAVESSTCRSSKPANTV
jgi:hypothetical protein